MDDGQSDVTFPHGYMNHLKKEVRGPDVYSQEVSKQKTACYPSVEGLPKYAQTNGLQFMVKNVIKSMMAHKYANPFLRPVDRKTYVDYYDIIKKPMDLSYIKKKLMGKHYQNVSECIADFKQMFENCEIYNKDKNDPEILRMNAELKKHFQNKIIKLPQKEQPSSLKPKSLKKSTRTSFSGSINGSNYDLDDSSDDDVISHRSGMGLEEHTNSPSAFSYNVQERQTEDSFSNNGFEIRKSLKRKSDMLGGGTSPSKNKGPSNKQVQKKPSKELKPSENAGKDIDIGEMPANVSKEMNHCFEILREFYRRPLSARTSRYYQLENKINIGDTEEDAIAKNQLFMDLNTVLKKFKQNEYHDPEDFAADVRRIFTFIYRFSKHSPSLIKETQDIQNIFELKLANIPYSKRRHQSSFNLKIDSLIKVVKSIGLQLESLKDKEPPLKRRKISNEVSVHDLSPSLNNQGPPKPKPKPKAPAATSSYTQVQNKSPVIPKGLPPQKPQVTIEKVIPRELAPFLRPDLKDQVMTRDEMSKLSYVLQEFSREKLMFLTKLIHFAEPVEDPSKELELDLENLKPSTLRAIERYAMHCVGSEEYSQTKDHLDKKPLPLYSGRYKIPQSPAKTSTAPKYLHHHNKNASIGFNQDGEANTSSSSSSSTSSFSSSSSSSFVSSDVSHYASTTLITSTNTKPSSHHFPMDQTSSINGDNIKKPTVECYPAVPANAKPGDMNVIPKGSDSYKSENKQMAVQELAPKSSMPPNNDNKTDRIGAKSPPDQSKNSLLACERNLSEDRSNPAWPQTVTKDPGGLCANNNEFDENKTEGGTRFPAWGSFLQKSKSSAPQKPTINPDETFFKFKKQAEEKMEREKMSKQQEEDRRQRMELENDERLKKEKELKQAQEEEEALFGALGKVKPVEPQPCSSRSTPSVVPAPTNSLPASPKVENQQVLSPSERRLIEQQRRKNAARACQIDLNAQSEIFAAFERDLHGQSLMNH